MANTHTSGHGHEKPSPARRLVGFLWPERSDVGVIIILSVLNGILMLATPLAVDAVVNNIAFGGQELVYLQALGVLAVALLAFLTLLALMRGAQYYVMELIQERLFLRVAADLAYRLPRSQLSELEHNKGPEIVNRFFEIVTVQKSSAMLLLEGVNLVLATLIGFVVLGFYHPFLLAFALALVSLLAIVLFVLGRNAIRTSIEESYAKHAVAGWLDQVALFPVLFKSHGAADFACQRADQLARHYLVTRRAHFRILLRQIFGLLGLQALASAALLAIGALLVLRGELTLGQLVASELIVGAIVAYVAKFGKHLESFYDAMAAVDKLGFIVDLPIESDHGEKPTAAARPAEVRADKVCFSYDSSRVLLDTVSFIFAPGSRVAITCATGFGASTLLDLIFGLRKTSAGMLSIDGMDVRHWNLDVLREQVALVRGQEIVEGTIAENVRMGRLHIGMDAVRAALETVGLLDAVLKFSEGLDTPLMPGGRSLSSSQRTRLVLARAIIGKPRLLLLDECLDGLEVRSLEDMEKFFFGREHPWTLVLVTRDQELVQRCDKVLQLSPCHMSSSTTDAANAAS